MVGRRTTILLVGLVVLAGVALVATGSSDAPPTLTVTNDAETEHRVSAYTVDSTQSPSLTNFRVTTDDGERRLATLKQLRWAGEFRNVTLADDGIPFQSVTVAPGATETRTIDRWTPGNVTIYIVEDLGDDERHVLTSTRTCTRPGQEHSITLRDDGASESATCT